MPTKGLGFGKVATDSDNVRDDPLAAHPDVLGDFVEAGRC
jgi:hypothetical protein